MVLVNTGEKEKRQLDINPNSPTFGAFRWVSAGTDLTACPLPETPVYASAAISQIVFRNDCGENREGSGELYQFAAGYKTSTVSQEQADLLARADFDATKQAFANANGTCNMINAGPEAPGGGGEEN